MQGQLGAALEGVHREIDRVVELNASAAQDQTAAAHELVGTIKALRRHVYFEEEHLFPPLRRGALMPSIFVMERDHAEIWKSLDTLDAAIGAATGAPELTEACALLVDLLDAHDSKEEPTIYAHADEALGEVASAHLVDLLTSVQMPEGWTCRRARP